MADRLRTLTHPGPVAVRRSCALPCRAHPLTLTLQPGRFDQALAAAFGAQGFQAGYARLADVALPGLAYLIPGPASTEGHAAWYSEAPPMGASARIVTAGAHLGWRDGAPFVHCHGLWQDSDRQAFGHILPADNWLHAPAQISGWGLSGAQLVAEPDPETRFTLFQPAPAPARDSGLPALLATLRPNQDICAGLAQLAQGAAFANARVEGLGSCVYTTFADGGIYDSYATENLLTHGRITDGQVSLDAIATGISGVVVSGRLTPGANAICVTAELLLIAE